MKYRKYIYVNEHENKNYLSINKELMLLNNIG